MGFAIRSLKIDKISVLELIILISIISIVGWACIIVLSRKIFLNLLEDLNQLKNIEEDIKIIKKRLNELIDQ